MAARDSPIHDALRRRYSRKRFLVPHRPATSSGRAREVVMELSESLAQFGMTEREPGTLVVACVHNFVILEYRINAGLLWSRVLLPDGSEFLDGVSDWEALQLEEVLSLMRAKPPIAAWLRLRAPRPGLAR